jgi:hypothetical protein
MRTFDFHSFYVMFISLQPGSPFVHTFVVDEIDGRCRTSLATFIRLWPLRLALGVGRWQPTGLTVREQFERVFQSRSVPFDGEVARHAREAVAAHSTDVDDEWELLEMLDLDT